MWIDRLPWRVQTRITKFLAQRSWSLSQAGQDLWVFGEVFNEKTGGFLLDIGAHDGITISNTYVLERRYGGGLVSASKRTPRPSKTCNTYEARPA